MKSDNRILVLLDRAFWVVWAILPVVIGARLYFLFTYGSFDAINNAGEALPIMAFSFLGKILVCFFLIVGLVFYISLLVLMQILIRQFRDGLVFVENTLRCMTKIAVLMLVWPFLKIIMLHGFAYGLYYFGDAPTWELEWFGFDLSMLASGLVVLALRFAMAHAIRLYQEAEYTI